MSEVPATELDAVNVILTNMGEAPINSLDGDLPLDALKAQGVLVEISRAIQSRGWFWNREIQTLALDLSNKIPLPSNTLEVKSTSRSPFLTNRSGYLYRIEVDNNGDEFTEDQQVELTLFLPHEDLPPTAKRYITLKAARIFQARELGNELLLRNDTSEEQFAWHDIRAEDNANSYRNLQKTWSVAMVTDRNSPVKVGY